MKGLIVAAVISLGCAMPLWAEQQPVITVTGHGVVETVPDIAMLNIGVTREARRADAALDATSAALAAVLARLQQSGVEDRDMQTSGISVQPRWNRASGEAQSVPQITGFVARNGVRVRIRDLDSLGAILNTVVMDGANTLDGLQFSVADPEAALAEARAEAVKDGLAKAKQMAAAAGLTLGPVLSITEVTSSARPEALQMSAARMSDAVPVVRGEVGLSAQVSLEIALIEE